MTEALGKPLGSEVVSQNLEQNRSAHAAPDAHRDDDVTNSAALALD